MVCEKPEPEVPELPEPLPASLMQSQYHLELVSLRFKSTNIISHQASEINQAEKGQFKRGFSAPGKKDIMKSLKEVNI